MPFNGSGGFTRVRDWTNDAAAAIKIRADYHDDEDDNFASGLSMCLTKDGQQQPSANIPMNGKRIINLANATGAQDAATLNDLTSRAVRYDAGQALTIAQLLTAHTNLAATASVLVKGAAYTLLAADRGKLLRTTAALVMTLPSAASVGNDFKVDLRTMGGELTLRPTTTDLIENANVDFKIADLTTAQLWSDGLAWWASTAVNAPAAGTEIVRDFQATGTWTKPLAGLKMIKIRGQGPGGGGSGAAVGTASNMSGGGGAGAGSYGEKTILAADLTLATYPVTIGAGGAAGTTGGTNGGVGATSSFGSLCTFPGGDNAVRATLTSVSRVDGGSQSAAPTGCDLALLGMPGDASILFWNASLILLGSGGKGFWGVTFAQNALVGPVAGATPAGWGSGARSACNVGTSSPAKAGGVGGDSRIIVTECY